MYRISYDASGRVAAVNRAFDGASLPYNTSTKTFDETHSLVIELRNWEIANGELDLSDRAYEPLTLEDAIAAKQQEIVAAAREELEALVADYPPAEQATWDRKVAEAKAVIASENVADAPLLEFEANVIDNPSDAAERLTSTLFLANAIVTQSEQLYQASAFITAKRAKLWGAAAVATSVEEVEAIVWK